MSERTDKTGPEKQLQSFLFHPESLKKCAFSVSIQNNFTEQNEWILYLIFQSPSFVLHQVELYE